jgi:signal transduction histidine kinase/ligand-binding sensor domain-containing protein
VAKTGVSSILFKLLLAVLLVWTARTSFAIHYPFTFKQLSYEQGLPGTNVRDQLQDKDGIMWIGIESYGLCRFDGHKFHTYKNIENNPHSLSSNYVNKMVEDNLGLIWVATENGLNCFDKRKEHFDVFYHIQANSSTIPDNLCHTVFIDSEQKLWVGTSNGVAIKDANSGGFSNMFSTIHTDRHLEKTEVWSIGEYPKGIIWLGTNNGLIRIDQLTGQYRQWNSFQQGQKKQDLQVLSMLAHGQQIWIGSKVGLLIFNTNDETISPFPLTIHDAVLLADEGFCTMISDNNGMIWAGSITKGLLVIDPNTYEYQLVNQNIQNEYPLKSNNIRSLFVDNMGMVWVGTKFKGLFKYNGKERYFADFPKGLETLKALNDKYIMTVYDDRDGTIWIGTKHDGLYKVNNTTGTITKFLYQANNPNSLGSNRVNYVFRDSHNRLWVGTGKGLFQHVHNNAFESYSSLSVNWICEDQTGLIWVGTSEGIFIVDRNNKDLKHFETDNEPHFFKNSNLYILQVYEDQSGLLWFVTRNNGLITYSHVTDECKVFDGTNSNDNLPPDYMVRAVYNDSSGRLWLGTKSKGLLLIDRSGKIIKRFNTHNGLPSEMILNIEEDDNGNLWLGTANGICLFNPVNNEPINFSSDHGIKSNISEKGASAKLQSGFLFFGGNNGFNVFHPDQIPAYNSHNQIVITSVKINNDEILNYISTPTYVKLGNKHAILSIDFALPDYNNPFRHKYSVFLSGINEGWREIGNRNNLTFNNLPPGKYELKLKAANEYGIFTDEAYLLNINVLNPIFKALWFKLTVICLVLFLIGFAYLQFKKRQSTLEMLVNERTRKLEVAYKELLNKNTKIREQNRQIELHHQELEQKVAKRTRDLEIAKRKAEESDRLKSSFLANMSHEVRTPLNAISGFSTLVCSDLYGAERKQKYVNIIKTNVTSLLKLVEDILDISKIEAGQLTIEKDSFDFTNMILEINATFQEEIKNLTGKSIKLICENNSPTDTIIEFYSDQLRIRQIMMNLLNNAIKFTKIGKIEFGYKINEGSITLWVSDTGIGIKKTDMDSIFDRFTKIEGENAIYRGTGLGLSISKSLVNLLGGRIWVESEINIGSTFYFEIPGEIKLNRNWQIDPIKKTKTTQLNLTNKTALIVEPERSSFMLLHSFLLPTHLKITWAHNAASAIELCKTQTFDIIIQELCLPDIDGFTLYKQITELQPKTPVIAQTAYATPDEKKNMTATGFRNFIIKPYLRDDLFTTIAEVL